MDYLLEQALLEVSAAAEQAHKLGLKYAGYGIWKNKAGVKVAKTVNDKLVKLSKTGKPKLSSTHHWKSKAGKKKAPKASQGYMQPLHKKTSKKLGKEYDLFFDSENAAQDYIEKKYEKNVSSKFANDTYKQRNWRNKLKSVILTQPSMFAGDSEDMDAAEDDFIDKYQYHNGEYPPEALVQKFRKKYKETHKITAYDELRSLQESWQVSGQWTSFSKSAKKKMYRFLNDTLTGNPPAVIHRNTPIYRGMNMSISDGKKFLKNFKVGKTVQLPPSGFSEKIGVATDFAFGYDHFSAVIVLHPKNNKMIGLHCNSINNSYSGEREIIRPGRLENKVLKIEKVHITEGDKVCIIHLQETFKKKKKGLLEIVGNMTPQEILDAREALVKYMEGGLSMLRGKEKSLLNKYMGGSVNQIPKQILLKKLAQQNDQTI